MNGTIEITIDPGGRDEAERLRSGPSTRTYHTTRAISAERMHTILGRLCIDYGAHPETVIDGAQPADSAAIADVIGDPEDAADAAKITEADDQ